MSNRSTSKVRILSIDGGGIRGIIPGTIVEYLETRIRAVTGNKEAKIGEYFDMIAGTSTGGILTSIYLMPDEKETGKAKFSATDAVQLYMQYGNRIFNKNFWQQFKNFSFWNESFPADNLEKLLQDYLGDTSLSQMIKPCVITAYNFYERRAAFFNSANSRKIGGEVRDFKIRNVARATSAAPTYFEPAMIYSLSEAPQYLIDGGVFVNNPALCAYSEARGLNFSDSRILYGEYQLPKPNRPAAKDMLLISIGTGSSKKKYEFEQLRNAGLIKWLPVLIDIMMSGNSETVHYHLVRMWDTLEDADKGDYYRIDPDLKTASPDMDNVSKKNLKLLKEAGESYVFENTEQLNEIVDKLLLYN
ncbi:patatin-like phospholipase/acyl hydrolase [Lacibacter cauensis]|uniref:Patatin-like phospholipase/acyl hydrolase n=1 Tax=Lacibacter cauensis TaxID=510947 RepID=A0A562SGM3_9BACT|nr:patatin-like phospholipase family protein [Lacibacter cauensis]TWI80402.1 patatin-like phospholipase/acyl hydrolase [Lacibacter cauensis]